MVFGGIVDFYVFRGRVAMEKRKIMVLCACARFCLNGVGRHCRFLRLQRLRRDIGRIQVDPFNLWPRDVGDG